MNNQKIKGTKIIISLHGIAEKVTLENDQQHGFITLVANGITEKQLHWIGIRELTEKGKELQEKFLFLNLPPMEQKVRVATKGE